MNIRLARIEDASAIQEIYAPYVRDTAISFEYEVPTVEEMQSRIEHTLEKYPYLVAVEDNAIVGYAYAGPFHTRAAFQYAAELSVYIKAKYKSRGIGRLLYQKLEEMLLKQGICTVHACIASPEEVDEYLTNDSEFFHRKMGFEVVGRHTRCGYKFGKWYSIIWMDKRLKEDLE